MQRLAAALARELHAGDVYLLYGAVGAGKSAFSRAFIRVAAEDPYLTVPSPTFLLQQIYDDHQGPPIHHFDLYRLEPGSDMGRLDLGASFSAAACLVEWPERLAAGHAPRQRLELWIEIIGEAEQRRLEDEWRREDGSTSQPSSASGSDGTGSSGADGSPGTSPGAARTAGASSSAISSGGGSGGGSGSDSGLDDGSEGDEEEDGDDPYTDRRWRRVRAVAFGDQWAARLARLGGLAGSGALSSQVKVVEGAGQSEVQGAAAVDAR